MGVPVYVGDRVLVTTTTTGTGTYSIGSAVSGYLTPALSGIVSGSRVSYVVVDSLTAPSTFEVGEGVYTSGAPATITRAAVYRNTSGGTSAVSWAVGTKYLFLAPTGSRYVLYDTDGNLVIYKNAPRVLVSKTSTADYAAVVGQNNSVTRWEVVLGSQASETGSNAGSNFQISRFSDAGAYIDAPISISRGDCSIEFYRSGGTISYKMGPAGQLGVNGSYGTAGQMLHSNGSGAAATWASAAFVKLSGDAMTGTLSVNAVKNVYGAAGTERLALWSTNATIRWALLADSTAESGANAGSNLVLRAVSDSGTTIGSVFEVNRATRVMNFIVNPTINGAAVATTASTISGVTAGTGLNGGGTSGAVTLNITNTFNAVGTYSLLYYSGVGGISIGNTVSGAELSNSVTGTWRYMGKVGSTSPLAFGEYALFVKVS